MSGDQTDKKWPLTGFFSTPERLRARFNIFYEAKDCFSYGSKADVTEEDFDKYQKLFPAEAEKLQKMRNQLNFAGTGAGLGLVGSAIYFSRITKTVPLVLTGVVLSTFTSHMVSTDIGSWIYGTYKFDVGDTNRKFQKWAYMTKNGNELLRA